MDWDFAIDPSTGEMNIVEKGKDPNKLDLTTDLIGSDSVIQQTNQPENKPVVQPQLSPEIVALQKQIGQLTQGLNTITQFLTEQIDNKPQPQQPEFTMEDDVANSLFPDNADNGKKFMKSVVDNITKVVDDKLKEFKAVAEPITLKTGIEQEFQNSVNKYGQDFINYIPIMQDILKNFPELKMTSEQAYIKAKQILPSYTPKQQVQQQPQNLQPGQIRTHTGVRDLPDRLNSNAGEELHAKQIKTIDDAVHISMQEMGMIS